MKNILIVDDETRLVSTLISGLETVYGQDCTFLSAPNGQEAVEILESNSVDLVLTDLKMPVMNGFQLLAYMRSHFVSIPVIVLSAYGTNEIEVRLKKLGCMSFLAKPVDFKTLAHAIEEGLKGHATGGVIQNISVAGFLQLIEMENKTCMVEVRNQKSGHNGIFYFENGALYDAICGEIKGAAAARVIIGWEDVEIKFDDKPKFKLEKRINVQLMTLLLNAMKEKDESPDDSQSLGKPIELDEIADEIANMYHHPDESPGWDAQINEVETKSKSGNAGKNKNITNQARKESNMNVQKLNQAVEIMKKDLGEGLLATDIWMVADGVSIAAYNPQPKATALFNQLTTYLADTLEDSGFPGLGKYYILDLVDNNMVIILPMGEYRWGMMVNSLKIQLGLLLNIVIPKIIDAFEDAVTD